MRFSPSILLAAAGVVMLTACTPITETPAATATSSLSGMPAGGTPVGLLPAAVEASIEPSAEDPSAEPEATMQPVDLSDSQVVDTPDLGTTLAVPAAWSIDHPD